MTALFSKPKAPPTPAPIEMPKTPTVDQAIVDRNQADMLRRRRGRAATMISGSSDGMLPSGSVASKTLLGQ